MLTKTWLRDTNDSVRGSIDTIIGTETIYFDIRREDGLMVGIVAIDLFGGGPIKMHCWDTKALFDDPSYSVVLEEVEDGNV